MDIIDDALRAVRDTLRINSRQPKPAIEKPVNGLNIWLYVSPEKESQKERINKEIDKRGLSVGELRFERSTFGIKLRFPSRTGYSKVLAAAEKALSLPDSPSHRLPTLRDGNLRSLAVVKKDDHAMVTTSNSDRFPFHCVQTSGLWNGEPFNHRVFMRVDGFIESSASIECYSPEAVDIALLAAKELDLEYDEPHYAHESAIPLHQIVTTACRWRDKQTGKLFVHVAYRENRVRHQSIRGQHVQYDTRDPRTGIRNLVLASKYDFPSLSLNNMVVGTWRVFRPTKEMLAARDSFRKKEYRLCSINQCSGPAVKEVTVNRSMVEDIAGSWENGSVYYVCADPKHAKIIMGDNPRCACEMKSYKPEHW